MSYSGAAELAIRRMSSKEGNHLSAPEDQMAINKFQSGELAATGRYMSDKSELKEEQHKAKHVSHAEKKKKGKNDENIVKEIEMDEHIVTLEELYQRYGVNPEKGLDGSRVEEMREKYGKNELTPPKKTPAWLLFLKELLLAQKL
mgnify:CR=1 FL=1